MRISHWLFGRDEISRFAREPQGPLVKGTSRSFTLEQPLSNWFSRVPLTVGPFSLKRGLVKWKK